MSSLEIAERIEAELKRKGIKKSDFYEKCGVSRASFSQWRHDLHYPTKETLDRINDFLGLTFSVTETGGQKEPPQPEAETVSAERQELYELIDKMTAAELVLFLERGKRIIESRG